MEMDFYTIADHVVVILIAHAILRFFAKWEAAALFLLEIIRRMVEYLEELFK